MLLYAYIIGGFLTLLVHLTVIGIYSKGSGYRFDVDKDGSLVIFWGAVFWFVAVPALLFAVSIALTKKWNKTGDCHD